jgi:hypothetical protein
VFSVDASCFLLLEYATMLLLSMAVRTNYKFTSNIYLCRLLNRYPLLSGTRRCITAPPVNYIESRSLLTAISHSFSSLTHSFDKSSMCKTKSLCVIQRN